MCVFRWWLILLQSDQANRRRYCNLDTEISFVSLTAEQVKEAEEYKPDKKEKKKDRKERDEESPAYDVVITWAEECLELHDYFSTKMSGSLVNIVVLPLPSGLYHIRVYRKEKEVLVYFFFLLSFFSFLFILRFAATSFRSALRRRVGGLTRGAASSCPSHCTQCVHGLQAAQWNPSPSVR